MALSTIASVASFSAVLAETFAAVGMSTLIPNALVLAAKAAKPSATGGTSPVNPSAIEAVEKLFHENNPVRGALATVRAAAASMDHIDLLVPKKATIDAEFEFQAAENYSASASVGAAVNVVTVNAGYSALYETSSRNKVSLHVEFGLVGIDL